MRSMDKVKNDIERCRNTSRYLYIEKLKIKKRSIENNIELVSLRIEEEEIRKEMGK